MITTHISGEKVFFVTHIRFHFDIHSKALVHVSTAYCNCDRTEINEVIYSTPYDPANIINLINWLPEDVLDKVCVTADAESHSSE